MFRFHDLLPDDNVFCNQYKKNNPMLAYTRKNIIIVCWDLRLFQVFKQYSLHKFTVSKVPVYEF